MSILNKNTHNKIYYYNFLLLAFFIPIQENIVAILISILVLNWLLEANFVKKAKEVLHDRKRSFLFLFSILYFFYLVGLLYTKNLQSGFFDVQVKLSLLIFPLIFSTLDFDFFDKKKINKILFAFVLSTLLLSVVCLITAYFDYRKSLWINEFYYVPLSNINLFGKEILSKHPSYFAMFLNFAFGIIFLKFAENQTKYSFLKNYLIIFTSIVIFIFVSLLSSKAGIAGFLIVSCCIIVYLIVYKKQYFISFIMVLTVPILFFFSIELLPNSFNRIISATEIINSSEKINKNTIDGTAERILVWNSALEILKNNFLFGVGTGDVKDFLVKEYKKENITAAYKQKLNAHNQYIQTSLSIGFFGLIVLLISLLLPFVDSFKIGNFLFIIFLLLISFNFLFESMLERQSGVVFYAFFNSLLFFSKKDYES
ncbi:MAG: O-antigen ligase family protein [Bacteroidales bacterium]|nr:O-antigen ligase family protein [Bacteroidales bacterium]